MSCATSYLNGGIATPREMLEQSILPRFLSHYERYDGFGVWAAIEKVERRVYRVVRLSSVG